MMTKKYCDRCDNYKGCDVGCVCYDSDGAESCVFTLESRTIDIRVQILAELGIISGQVAYMLTYGKPAETA